MRALRREELPIPLDGSVRTRALVEARADPLELHVLRRRPLHDHAAEVPDVTQAHTPEKAAKRIIERALAAPFTDKGWDDLPGYIARAIRAAENAAIKRAAERADDLAHRGPPFDKSFTYERIMDLRSRAPKRAKK